LRRVEGRRAHGRGREREERVAAFVELQRALGGAAGADEFAVVGDINEAVGDRAGGAAESGVGGADDADAVEVAEGAVEIEAEVGDGAT
jgi:hypothetical protein